MAKFTPTNATLEQALELTAAGKFPYYHPCCKCNKACSMPTLPLWEKRVAKFGSVHKVYAEYVCRDCSKGAKPADTAPEPAPLAVVESPVIELEAPPVEIKVEAAPIVEPPKVRAPMKAVRAPGDPIRVPKGHVGVTVYENGIPIKTEFTKLSNDEG